jgi:flagellar biogenesis protein FliO
MPSEERTGATSEPPPEAENEEPTFTGTLFLMAILLMLIFGFWVMMYLTLLER